MHAFHEHIGGYQYLFVWIVHYGTIITYTINGRGILVFVSFCEMVDKTKLTQFCDVQFVIRI